MLRLTAGILVLALIWMVWWAFGSTALDRSLSSWIDARRAEGWAADVSDIEVNGFPNRFDTTLSDVRLADPATGVAWSAPFLQLLALAYRPNQVIAVLPNEHVLSTPLQTLNLSNAQARGSIFLGASTSLPLERSTIIIDELKISSSAGWQSKVAQGRFATEAVPARENAHRIGAEISGLTLSKATRELLDPGQILPDTIDTFRLDADLGFTAPWDRFAIEVQRPQITDIDLRDLSAVWGDVNFRAVGQVAVSNRGIPTGEVTVKAVEWRRLLDMAVAAGVLAETFVPSAERALEILAALKGPPNTIDATLTLRDGLITFGPIPLGPAPRIVIR